MDSIRNIFAFSPFQMKVGVEEVKKWRRWSVICSVSGPAAMADKLALLAASQSLPLSRNIWTLLACPEIFCSPRLALVPTTSRNSTDPSSAYTQEWHSNDPSRMMPRHHSTRNTNLSLTSGRTTYQMEPTEEKVRSPSTYRNPSLTRYSPSSLASNN